MVADTSFEERNGQFSPDGRWVAYETDESGQFETVVQAFPEPKGKWQVSRNGGTQPRWRADGKELYFMAPDGKIMAAPITVADPIKSAFETGPPVALFSTRIIGAGFATFRPQYAVSRDGRFLVNEPVETNTIPITLVVNAAPDR